MSSMPPVIDSKFITGEELLEMGDIGPCELIEGRIVPMSPAGARHGHIEVKVATILQNFVTAKDLGWVMTGEVGIFTKRGPDSVRGADVLFISKERLAKIPDRGFLEVAPELVVEVRSADETKHDIQQKINEYLAIGVKWVWYFEPKTRNCSVHRLNKDVQKLAEKDVLIGEEILTGLDIKLSTLFDN